MLSHGFLCEKLDDLLTLVEVNYTSDALNPGKAPGKDCIPAEIIRIWKILLNTSLHNLFIKCWDVSKIPQDLKDVSIITLYKTRETTMTVITTEVYHCWASLASCTEEFIWDFEMIGKQDLCRSPMQLSYRQIDDWHDVFFAATSRVKNNRSHYASPL